jgi:hypothetical protein
MNMRMLRPLAASALLIASFGQAVAADALGEHPAVLVAKTWSTRGIDPNTFIVAHPARLTLLAASPTERDKAYTANHSAVGNRAHEQK